MLVWILIVLTFNGCATGYMSSSTYDSKIGRTIAEYTPLFSTESLLLAEGVEFRVSVVITRRVEPISYGLLASVGGLTSDDLKSKATAVIHFKNGSEQIYRVNLKEINILNQGFLINVPEIVLKPGDRFDTKQIAVKVPTYDTSFALNLNYEIDGKPTSQIFSMNREMVSEVK